MAVAGGQKIGLRAHRVAVIEGDGDQSSHVEIVFVTIEAAQLGWHKLDDGPAGVVAGRPQQRREGLSAQAAATTPVQNRRRRGRRPP